MPLFRTLVRGRFSRDLWGVAALLFALALAGSIVVIRLGVDREERDALSRARTVADSAIAPLLSRAALEGALEGPEAEPLRTAVREAVLADPRIVRVRVWRPDGTLLFSTDPRDDVGRVIPPIDVGITDAVEGTPGARVTEPGEVRRGLAHDAELLLRTFVPLIVEGPPPAAAAEIDFRRADLVAAASAPWRPAQVALGVGLALALALLLVSMRAGRVAPEALGGTAGRVPEEARPPRGPTPEVEAVGEHAAALARKLKQAETRIGALEGEIALLTNQLRRAEMERADGRPVPGAARAVREAEEALATANERVQEAEARAAQAEARAREAAARAAQAEQTLAEIRRAAECALAEERARAAQAETRVREATAEAERARAEVRAATEALAAAEARATAAERERTGLEEGLRRAEAALAEARARLEEAAAGAGRAGEAAAAEVRARAEEADRRAREAEERAREALAERRLAERSAGLAGAEPGLAALEERVQAAEARARRAEELLEELHLALSTASLPPEAGELRERLARAGSTRHRHEAQEPEAAIRGAIAHELRSALARVLGSSLTLKAAVGTQEGQEALRHLNAATRRLDRLVQDLQDAPRLADGSLPLRRRRTDLEALLRRVVGEAEGLEQMVVELSTREAKATVDAARVEQILEAILEIVRARGAPGSTIRVVLAPEEGGARISVEDAGPVPASLPGELALAARLAELHGGRLWVEERSGGGTAFRLSLPERAPEAGAAPAPEEGARPQTGRGSTA